MRIHIRRGDLMESEVDAIVTAANAPLIGGGGVDRAVHRASGPRLLDALRPLAPCQPGRAVITSAFDLAPQVQWVVHAVGPRYGVDDPADSLLASAYLAALARCDEVGARTVAFPSLSTGAFHFPLLEACQISVKTLANATTAVKECQLVALDAKTEKFWSRALAGHISE